METYLSMHRNLWPELIQEHESSGTIQISSFIRGNELIVYFEWDDEKEPKELPIRKEWRKQMDALSVPDIRKDEFQEVFYLRF
jgi:L-rhamnose mutarotase